MLSILRFYRGSSILFSGHRYPIVKFTFYPMLQRAHEDVTCIHIIVPKIFLKEISVQPLTQFTTAVVVKHAQNKIN